MDSEIKILKLLLDNKEKHFTIRQISSLAKINYRIAYEKVDALEKDGLLTISRAGQSKLCDFNYTFNSKVYLAEANRRLDLFKKKDFLVLYNRLANINSVFITVLFGSHAKGTANKNSDIDILAIDGDEKEIRATLSMLPDKIHLTFVTSKEFIHMAKSKEFSVVGEAIKNNIILIGIEDYYRLLDNARR